MLYLWYANPSFGWYKVIVFSNLATTTKIRLPGAQKLGAELIFMSLLGRHPHWQSIIIRTPPISFSNMSKTGKNPKNPLDIRNN
jgi:hypothetical protein